MDYKRKNNWKNRIGSLFLVLSILIGTIPMQTFAMEVVEQVATPTYNESLNPDNLFTGSTNFTLSCTTKGAKLYYTLDGTIPTTQSNQFYYEEPNATISIDKTTTIKAYAVKAGMEDSEVLTFVLTKAERVKEPKLTPTVENFQGGVEVAMTSDTEDATIYYSINGKEPTKETGTLYTNPFTLNKTTSIQAIAYKEGMNPSFVTYKTYTYQDGIKLKANTEYSVSAHIVTAGYSGGYGYHDLSGFYGDPDLNYKMNLVTDANGKGTLTIPCIYKWLKDDYFMDLQFYTDNSRTDVVQGYTFETVADSGTSSDELKAVGTLPLPNHEVGGIYYGIAKTVEQYDGFKKDGIHYKGNVELRVEWDTLKEVVDQVETPTFSAPDQTVFEKTENEVIIRTNTPGATIYYTEDEYFATHPSEADASEVKEYTGPINITKKVNIAAIAKKDGLDDSELVRVSYDVKAKPELEQNSIYEVGIEIKDVSYDWLGYEGRYEPKATITTDANGNQVMSIQCIYKGGYTNSYIQGLRMYEDDTRATMIADSTYEVKSDSTEEGALRGVASFTLPYIDGKGVYYGEADHNELDWNDEEVVTEDAPVELIVDWTSLEKKEGTPVVPPITNPDESEEFEERTFKVYGTLIDSEEDPDSVEVPFMLGNNGFLGMYGPQLTIKQATDGKKTVVMDVLSGINWDTFATIYFKDMTIFTDKEKRNQVSELSFAATLGNGSVSYVLGKDAVLEGRDTYYVTATLQDDTVKTGMLIIDWDQMTEVLPFTTAPEFTPNGGTLSEGDTITLTCSDPDAKIYYAIGQYMNPFFGNELQDYAIEYTGPFTIEEGGLYVAQSYTEGKAPSSAVEAEFHVKGGAETLGDIETITYDTSHTSYDKLEFTSADTIYKTIMNTGNGMPTVSEYYLLVSQGENAVRHLYNGGVGGFSVVETNDGGSRISVLLEKDKWDASKEVTFTFIAKGYANKELTILLSAEEISKQQDVEASKGNTIINREDIEVGQTYKATFTAIKTGTNDESMLAGFFEPIAKIEVGETITNITFRNMVMPDQLQDFGLKGSGDWKGAVEDGKRVETESEALFTIPVSTEDFKEGFFTGGVNVLAMGGSLANNGVYSTYTSVEITFEDEITDGFEGFEGNLNGLTEEIIRNRNLLVGAPGIDANRDGYVSDDEIRIYAPRSKKLDLSTGNLTGLGYSTFDNIQMEDISWVKLLNPKNFTYIDLSGHHIAEITDEFKGFTRLTTLNLRANNIRTIEDNAFSDLGKLEELGLSSNLLTIITDKTFAGLHSIGKGSVSEFGLGQNALAYIEPNAFQDMKYVKGLFLYENQLEIMPKGVLNGMDSLEILYVESNHLKTVPADVATCSTLKEVKLYNNEISDIKGAFYKTIETIDLSGNYIEEVPTDLLNIYRKRILLEDNAIVTMPKAYVEKALEDSVNFGTVFRGNPIDVTSISGLTAAQKSAVSKALKGVMSTVVNLEVVAKDGIVSYTSKLSAFDYFFWNLAMLDKNKGAVKQALGKETISNVTEYQKFRAVNLKSFSKEDISKSILSDDFGTIVDYTITTRLQVFSDGTWITMNSDEVKGEDKLTQEYDVLTMKDGDLYRVVKTVGKYKMIANAVATVEEKEDPDTTNPDTANPDTTNPDTTNPDTTKPGTGNGQNDGTLDVKNLKDGVYSVTGKMLKTDKSTLSMANAAFNQTVKLTVKNGKYTITLDFKGMDVSGMYGYLGKLNYYTNGYTVGGNGIPQGSVSGATVASIQKNEDGTPVIDRYGTNYPDVVSFPLVASALNDGYAPLQVFVPIMDAIAAGSGKQSVYLHLNWKTLKSTSANSSIFDDNSTNRPNESEKIEVPSVTANNKTDEQGNVELTFDEQSVMDKIQSILEQGIVNEEGKTELRLEGSFDENGNMVTIKLSKKIMEAISDNLDQVVVQLDAVEVVIPSGILAELAETTEEVELEVKKIVVSELENLSDEVKKEIGNRPIFDINLVVNGEKIHEFKEDIIIRIPYVLKAGENPKNLTIYYINDNGEVEVMEYVRYREDRGILEFRTKHFSAFAVGYREPVEAEEELEVQSPIEEQELGVNKGIIALIIVLTMVLGVVTYFTVKNKKRIIDEE